MLRANGLSIVGMDTQEAAEIVAVLVATNRAVPIDQWVDELVAERELATLESLI